jgi:hypothetical protein
MKIGLSMIVKNEEHCILDTLENLCSYINFDYYIISDTGSTDNTKHKIKNFFENKKIKGEIYDDVWKDFGTNRTKALNHAYNKTDYLLIFDADDKISGNFILPKKFEYDEYRLIFKQNNIQYVRPLLINNRKKWKFVGVLHEYLECLENKTSTILNGDYFLISGRTGNRSKNENKYLNDALILENAIKKESDENLKIRYTFYLGQSYRDCGEKEKSIYWYEQRSKMKGWDQEVYWSLYQIASLKQQLNYNGDDIIQSYMKAYESCPSRIEALHGAIKYCRLNNMFYQGYIIGKYAKSLPLNKNGLFIEYWIWDYGLDDEFSVCCYWTKNYKEGLDIAESLLTRIPDHHIPRIVKNISFFKEKLIF